MRIRLIIFTALAAMSAVASADGLNSPDLRGYLERGAAMYEDGNYAGCIDQISHIYEQSCNSVPDNEAALYYMAMATLYSGDDEAIDLLRLYVKKYPESERISEVTKATGDFFFTRSNYPDALLAYRSIPAEALDGSLNEELLYRTAYCQMKLGEDTEADRLFGRLSGSKTYGKAAVFYRGYLAYSNGDYNKALEYFEKADTGSEPGNASPCYMAQIYFSRGDYNMALNIAKEELERGCPEEFAAEMNRIAGESYYILGDAVQAGECLEKYMALCETPRRSAMYVLGVCMYGDGEYGRAIPLFQKVASMTDAMGQSAYLYLGQCYVKQNNTDGALMAFENAYRQNYDRKVSETAFYNYIVARQNGGRVPFGNSVSLLEEFLKAYPESVYADSVRESLVSGYLSGNDYVAALRVLDNVRHQSGATLFARQKVLFVLGTRSAQRGENEPAIEYFSRAIDGKGGTDMLRSQSYLWRGISRYNAGDYAKAESDLTEYLKRPDGDAMNMVRARYYRGYSRFASGNYDDASGDFKQVAANSGAGSEMRADAYNRMGDCSYYGRDYAGATGYYGKSLKINELSGDYASYRIAVMKGLNGNRREKVAALQHVIERYPESALVPTALLEMAQTQAELGSDGEALLTYSRLTDKYPATAQGRKGMLEMALLQCETGKKRDGETTYRRVISTYPTSEEAAVAVEDMKRITAADGTLREFADYLETIAGAPRIEVSEIDAATFRAAERDYLATRSTARVEEYLRDYPRGSYVARALYYMAEYNDEEGKSAAACEYATRLTEGYPDAEVTEDAMLIKANNEEALGMIELAGETYGALEKRASTPQNLQAAREGLMNTSLKTGRYSRVVEVADRLLSTNLQGGVDADRVKMNRAIGLEHTGRGEEARSEWKRLTESQESSVAAQSAVLLGQSLLDADEPDRAIAVVNGLIDSGTPHNYWLARAYIVLSDALRSSGNEFEADEYLRLLQSNYPGKEADIQEMITTRLAE